MKENRGNYNTELCESVRALLSPYIDGRTTPAEAEVVQAHVASCDACRAELSQLRSLVQALRALPQLAAPRSFALPATGARSARASFLANVLWLRRAAAGLAACLVLLFGLGPYLGSAYRAAAPSPAEPGAPADRQAAITAAQATAAAAPFALQAPGQADASKAATGGEPTPQPVPAAAQAAAAPAPAQAPAAEATTPRSALPRATPATAPPAPAQEASRPQAATAPTPAAAPAAQTASEVAAAPPATAPPAQGRSALWIAQFALALAFLLAVVGAFLGTRGRAD